MLAINKVVLVIIFLIILAVGLYVLFGMTLPMGGDLEAQGKLRMCCPNFRATGCEDMTVRCNTKTLENLNEIAAELNMNVDAVKDFCKCP